MPDRVDTTELRKLLEAATPGPWSWSVYGHRNRIIEDRQGLTIATTPTPSSIQDKVNAALIVALRNQASALLDVLEERTKALEKIALCWEKDDTRAFKNRIYTAADCQKIAQAALNSAPSPRGGG